MLFVINKVFIASKKFIFYSGQELMSLTDDFTAVGSYPSLSVQHSTSGLLSQSNWPQSMLVTSNVSTSQAQTVGNLDFTTQKKRDAHSIDVLSEMDQDSLSSLAGNAFYVATTASAHIPVSSYLPQRIELENYGTSQGLTYNQSQILDNLTVWGKTQPKTSSTTMGTHSISHHPMDLQELQFSHNNNLDKPQHSVEVSSVTQKELLSGSTAKVVQTSGSTFKQVRSSCQIFVCFFVFDYMFFECFPVLTFLH